MQYKVCPRPVARQTASPEFPATSAVQFPEAAMRVVASLRGRFLLALVVILLGACSDSPTSVEEVIPRQVEIIPQQLVDLILPNVEYARAVLAPAIEDAAVRRSVEEGMLDLESGVRAANAYEVRLSLTNLMRIVQPYEVAHAVEADGPDVSALMSELDLVQQHVAARFARPRD